MTLARLKREPKPAADHSFEKVLERFIASQERKGRRSSGEMRRILEKDALPYWSGRPIESITPADVVERVEAIVDRGRPVAASRFRAWCSKLFSYAVKSQLRPDNPAKGVEDPVEPSTLRRDRKLEDDELVLVWQAAEKLGYPFGPLFQILLLTGQRLREVAEARWSELTCEPVPGRSPARGRRTELSTELRSRNRRSPSSPLSHALGTLRSYSQQPAQHRSVDLAKLRAG